MYSYDVSCVGAARGAMFTIVSTLTLGGCTSSKTPSPAEPSDDATMDVASIDVATAEPDAASDQATTDASCGVPTSFKWTSTGPVLAPVNDATHTLAAIKDPSIVYYNNAWHVFVSTVSAAGSYNMAYITFPDWDHVSSASFHYLDTNPLLQGYHAAPEVFFFTPQNKWYLIFQSGPPQYSTNTDIGNPAGWTRPANFFSAEPDVVTQNKGTGGWLDFFLICDTANCFLFFSDDAGTFYRSQTAIGDFPNGFGNTVVVMKDPVASTLFEASNVYRMKDTGKYLALVEAFDPTSNYHRYFRSWTADTLDGTWTPLQSTFAMPFAATNNVTFPDGRWTDDISHGEMLRAGYDETLTIDTCHLQYLYQGFDPKAPNDAGYNGIPWRLGLLTTAN